MRRKSLSVVCIFVVLSTFVFGCGNGARGTSELDGGQLVVDPVTQDGTEALGSSDTEAASVAEYPPVEFPKDKMQREVNTDIYMVEEPVEVIDNALQVAKVYSAYAHSQHIVEIVGKVRKDAGSLFLTLQDPNGKALQSRFVEVESVEPADGDWLVFSHKLIENVLPIRDDLDQGVVVFQLRKDGATVQGKLLIPLKKPPSQ